MTAEPTAISGPSDPRFTGRTEINRVAETQFHLRFHLERTLDAMVITDEGKQLVGGHDTYGAYWRASYGDRYFDMGTAQRLGTAIESGLRYYYKGVVGPDRVAEITRTRRGIFQRLVNPDKLIALLQDDCGVDLKENPFLPHMREIFVHRHLFAHRSGLVDEEYLNDLLEVTGHDLRPAMEALGYPDDDVAYFDPLRRLPEFIENARGFFDHLPSNPGALTPDGTS